MATNTITIIDAVKERIISQIKSLFPQSKIYDEEVKQGLEVPAFNVLIFNTKQERQLRHHAKRTYYVNVNFFPKDELNHRSECDRVNEILMNNFKYVGGKHHVHNFDSEIHDGTLVCTFTITVLLQDVLDYVKMQKLEVVEIESNS